MPIRVRILSDLADHVRQYQSGDEVELPDAQAEQWITAGLATPLATPPDSTSLTAPPDPTTAPPPRPRRSG
jgi:hypothetical protein